MPDTGERIETSDAFGVPPRTYLSAPQFIKVGIT